MGRTRRRLRGFSRTRAGKHVFHSIPSPETPPPEPSPEALTLTLNWSPGFDNGVVPSDTLADTILVEVVLTPSTASWSFDDADNVVYRDGVYLRLRAALSFPSSGTSTVTINAVNALETATEDVFITVASGEPSQFRYIRPVAAGLADGSSWANAAALTNFNSMLASTLVGGELKIRADEGTYTLSGSLAVSAGGASEKTIRGVDVDDNDRLTDIRNSRQSWTLPLDPEVVTSTTGWNAGNDVFRFAAGANNLTFKFIGFRNVSYGYYIRGNISNLTIEDGDGYNVRRFLEDETSTITGLIIRRLNVIGFSKQAIRLDGNTNDVLIEDFYLDSGRQADDAFAVGIACDNGSTCHDILIRSGIIKNCHYSSNPADITYQNADGISTEGANYDVTIQDVVISGCTDGGVDVKGGTPSGPIVLTRVTCTDNKRNFRLWCWGTVTDCVSNEPAIRGNVAQSGNIPTHLGLYSADADILVESFEMNGSNAAAQRFAIESSGACLRLNEFDDNTNAATDLIEIGATDPLIYNLTDPLDVTAPVWTADDDHDLDEGDPLDVELTNTTSGGEDVKFVIVSASDGITLSANDDRAGAVNLVIEAQDFESLADPALTAVVDVYNSRRVSARITITVNIQNVAGDTGGTVTETTSHGWRFDQPTAGTSVTLSGSENKTATLTTGGANVTVHGTWGMYPPRHYQTSFEVVPGVIGNAATFAVGLMNLSELQTVPLGTTNHSFGWFANGNVVLNGVTVATGYTYAATNVLRFDTTLNNWDWEDVRDNPSHIHDWKDRSVALYKNGVLQGTIDISEIVDALYPAVSMFTLNDAVTVRSLSSEWTTASASDFPDATTTGYSGSLSASGDISSSSNGQVIELKNVTGTINVSHTGVTVRNCKVTSTGDWCIKVTGTGCTIEDCELDGVAGGTGCNGVLAWANDCTVQRCNIYNCENGVAVGDNNIDILNNYIHTFSAGGSPHYDGVECNGGQSDILIDGNTIICDQTFTSAVMLNNENGTMTNIAVTNNFLSGGAYTVYADGNFNANAWTNVTFTGNTIAEGDFGYALIRGANTAVGVTYSGNTQLAAGASPPASTGFTDLGSVKKLSVSGSGAAKYVTPTGTGNGNSWAEAGGFSSIPNFIRSLGGSESTNPHLFIRADLGMYSRSNNVVTITGGGDAVDNPVIVTGVDVNLIPVPYHTFGARTAWILPNDPTQETTGTSGWSGAALFALSTGAQNITFQQFHTRRHLCSVNLKANCSGIIVQDASFYNNRRGLFESDSSRASDGLILRRFHGTGFSKQGCTIKGTTTGALVEYFHLNGGRLWNDSGYSGVKFDETAHDSIVRFGYAMQVHGDTGNLGDGVETNNGNSNIDIEDLVILQARDGGIDSKADGGTIKRCLAYSCTRNFKVWGDLMVHEDNFSYYTGAPAAQQVFHQGQDAQSRVTWHRHRMYNPGAIYMQNWNHSSRFIDGKCINESAAFAVTAMSTSSPTNTFDSGNSTPRLLFGLSTDVTNPTITSANSKSVVQGSTLAHTLTANENVTWEIVSGSYLAVNPGAYYDANFDIVRPNLQAPVLRFLNNDVGVYTGTGADVKQVVVRATDTVGNTSDQTFTATILESYVFADSDAAAFSARVGDLTTAEKSRLDTQVAALKSAGLWTLLEVIQDYRISLLNWKGTSYSALLTGAPPLGSTGYTLNGSTQFIDTNWNPSGSALASQNSIFHGVHFKTTSSSGSPHAGANGLAGKCFIHPQTTGGASGCASNQNVTTGGVNTGSGFYMAGRTASTTLFFRKNGGAVVITGNGSTASTGEADDAYRIGFYNSAYSGCTAAMFVAGAGLSAANADTLYGILNY